MNRQMVWHAFTVSSYSWVDMRHRELITIDKEFLIFILPLINVRTLHRRFARLAARVKPISLASLLPFHNPVQPDRDGEPAPAKTKGPYWGLSEDQCAICAENASYNLNLTDSNNSLTAFSTVASSSAPEHDQDNGEPPRFPITIPYITTCGHVYCYYCVADRMLRIADEGDEEVPGWECLRCAQLVKGAERVGIEIEESSTGELNSSEFDFSEMSGSITSYSEPLTDEVEGS